ncbi:MAG: FtsW/RodA/SpoVE family cell cycle protein [Saprospiraceae bacterium]|nr:FtsW/RodA/SpoVE family cell cycle protein [Saprospiraceae bacterium]
MASLVQKWRAAPADKYVLWIALMWSAVGVVAVYSAITFLAETKADSSTEQFLLRHVIRLGLALGVAGIFSLIDYKWLARFSRIALLMSLALLVLVKVLGVSYGNARRWLEFGGYGFQPSDLAKVALVLYVGVLLTKKQPYIKSLGRAFTPVFFWILLTVALIGLEDLSTAFLVLLTVTVMCFVGRVNAAHLAGLFGLCMVGAIVLLSFSPNRAARIESRLGIKIFSNTESAEVFSKQAEGYQAHQARIAFALGGLTGVGPGKSVQRDFLPAPYNDFIFAIIAEEYGLLGAVFLLGLFIWFLFRGFLRIARHAPDPLGLFLAVGFTTMIVLYGFIHAGVSCGLLPVTGLPMPMVSYGGTSMVATGIMLGILLNISRQAGRG